MANNPYSFNQMISKAYSILNRTGVFKEAIREWNRSPPQNKTWLLFKVHFQTAHAELLETQYLTLNDTTYNANMVEVIVNRVTETMNQQL